MTQINTKCKFMDRCPDIAALRKREGRDSATYKDLADQKQELCDRGGFRCSIQDGYLAEEEK